MDVVVAAGGPGPGLFLLPPILHVFGSAADVTAIQSFTVSLNLAHCDWIHFQNLWIRDKLVHKLLTIHFFDDILYIVVSEGSAEFVIIHVGLVLANPPKTSYLFCLQKLELPIVRGPADHVLILRLLQELKEELPQGDGTVHSSGRGRALGSLSVPASAALLLPACSSSSRRQLEGGTAASATPAAEPEAAEPSPPGARSRPHLPPQLTAPHAAAVAAPARVVGPLPAGRALGAC